MKFASGATLFKRGEELKIQPGGYIFAVSDNSAATTFDSNGNPVDRVYAQDFQDQVNNGWIAASPPFWSAPKGQTHITVYCRFDTN